VSRLRTRYPELGESLFERRLICGFLPTKNFPSAAVAALEVAGYDIVSVRMAAPGMSDPDVLAWRRASSEFC
jgi:hypothetical protein